MYTAVPTPPTEGVNTRETEIALRLGALYGSLFGLFFLSLFCIHLCSREGPCCPKCRKRSKHCQLVCCHRKRRKGYITPQVERRKGYITPQVVLRRNRNVHVRTNDLPPGVHIQTYRRKYGLGFTPPERRLKLAPSDVAIFQNFVKNTWMYDTRLGRDAIRLNHKEIIVKEVYRIENSRIWNLYLTQKMILRYKAEGRPNGRLLRVEEIRRRSMTRNKAIQTQDFDLTSVQSEPCDGKVNEVYLFHGTKTENVPGIIRDCFDLNSARDGLYGKGIYLAESAEKADQYTDSSAARRNQNLPLFLVRTLLGRSYIYDQQQALLHMPCVRKGCMRPGCTNHESFDSILAGNGKRFREFMLFNPRQCFPEFLIIYDRM